MHKDVHPDVVSRFQRNKGNHYNSSRMHHHGCVVSRSAGVIKQCEHQHRSVPEATDCALAMTRQHLGL